MQTQTSYGICAVRYSGERIATVQAIADAEDGKSLPIELSRKALMDAIQAGTKFVTLHRKADGTWGHWDAASVIPVGESAFIKLLDDRYALDDLGDLPEY